MFQDSKNLTLIVCGSIAAYKSPLLIRELKAKGININVILTEGGANFVTPLTLQTVSGNKVLRDLFDLNQESEIGHIKIADETDLFLVFGATADFISKMRFGLANDLATTTLLATKSKLLIAPAMNVNMWSHPATVENCEVLRNRGVEFIGPVVGDLACGWNGEGRLEDLDVIAEKILNYFGDDQSREEEDDVRTMALVTAGPTWEWIDPVRFIANRSSGKMGFAIAEELSKKGINICLVSGPTNLNNPADLEVENVVTAEEMNSVVLSRVHLAIELLKDNQLDKFVFFSVSAVCDHRPDHKFNDKIKFEKNKDYQINLTPNPDILANIGKIKAGLSPEIRDKFVIVGFCVETEADKLIDSAKNKLSSKGADYIVANLADDGFAGDSNKVFVVDRSGEVLSITDKKNKIALKLVQMIV